MVTAWLVAAAFAADLPWDDGVAPPIPDRGAVRVRAAMAPGGAELSFGDVDLALPLVTARRRTIALGVTAHAGVVGSWVPEEDRRGVGLRRTGGGLWAVLTDPTRRHRHAIGLVGLTGAARWYRWHPDEADTAFHIAYTAWIPAGPHLAVTGSTFIGVNRVQGIPPHARGHLGVVGEVHPDVALLASVIGGLPAHLQAHVGVRARPSRDTEVGVDVQLPVRAPAGWVVPVPTLGVSLTVRDARPGPDPRTPWQGPPG